MHVFRRLITAFVVIGAAPAFAQSAVVLWPTDPKIAADQQATALWLENRGTRPVTLQVRTLGWDQAAGEDREQPTNEVISSPPIAEVGPGERQLVRIIRRTPSQSAEQAYRLLIDELPSAPAFAEEGVAARLAVQMRYSLPLFVYRSQAEQTAPKLSSKIVLAEGHRWIEIRNDGNGHARLTDLRTTAGGTAAPIHAGLVGYVLPGASRRWVLPDDFDAATTVIVGVNGTDLSLSSQIAI